jgi:hypothetical protein
MGTFKYIPLKKTGDWKKEEEEEEEEEGRRMIPGI